MKEKIANLRRNWLLAVLSYIFLLLMVPTVMSSFTVFILLSLIFVLVFYSTAVYPKTGLKSISWNYLAALMFSILLSLQVAFSFYQTWIPSSKIERIASIFHISNSVFLIALCCAGFIAGVISVTQYIIYISEDSSVSTRKYGWMFLAVMYTYICTQGMVCGTIMSPDLLHILLNVAVLLFLIAFFCLITGNEFISICLGTLLPLLYATVDNYVYRLRGNEVTLLDFRSAQTALNVINEYNMSVPITVIQCWLGWIIMLLIIRNRLNNNNRETTVIRAQSLAVCGICAGLFFVFGSRLKPYSWNNFGSVKNGTILNLVIQIKDSNIKKPENYSALKIKELESKYGINENTNQHGFSSKEYPSIIVIMDESFTDFSVFGSEVNSNTDLIPFIRSIDQNVIKGYAYSSVYGGNTPNSEFEFLTGNSMGFLPNGSVAYQQYISGQQYSMIDVLHNLGYKCSVTHPYYASGWNRPRVYESFAFDDTSFIEAYPKKDLIRDYVSDQEMFEYIIHDFETREEDSHYFVFGITMQNHGGYLRQDFENSVSLNYESNYPKAEQFLSLAQLTDAAVEKFLKYFEKEDTPVLICFFGDHQPAIETGFLKELYGGEFNDINSEILKYKIPFFIWTNYDMDTKLDIETSLNYLSTYVFEAAGIELPPYNQFLKKVENEIPVISSLGYYSVENKAFLPVDEAQGQEKSVLNDYYALEYNNLFDKKNQSSFFGNE